MRIFVPCLVLLMALYSCSQGTKDNCISILDLKAIDTVTLDFKTSQCWNQYYHPGFNKTIVAFIEESPLQIVSVDPESLKTITFPLDKVESEYPHLSHPLSYYVIDSNFAIVNYQNDKFNFFRINRQGSVVNIIPVKDLRPFKDYDLYLYDRLLPVEASRTNDEIWFCLNYTPDFKGAENYISDRNVRNKKFSTYTNLLLRYSDSMIIIYSVTGNFPKTLQNLDGYYYLEPEYCLSYDGEVVNIFPSINYLGIQGERLDSTVFRKLIHSEISDASKMTSNNLFDYNYLSKYTYENSILMDIVSDRENLSYYVISTVADKYENPDGTVNDPVEAPWILMKLNSHFQITQSILFPKDKYSKHNFFFSSDFFYVLDNDLTRLNGKFTFVKFNKNWHE